MTSPSSSSRTTPQSRAIGFYFGAVDASGCSAHYRACRQTVRPEERAPPKVTERTAFFRRARLEGQTALAGLSALRALVAAEGPPVARLPLLSQPPEIDAHLDKVNQ